MKIVHFKTMLHPKYGGPSFSVPVQCRGVALEGVDVTLATFPESRPFEDKLIKDGVKISEIEHPHNPLLLKTGLSLSHWLKKNHDADIVHYHGVWASGCHWISKSARKYGIKTVLNPRGDLEIARINYNPWKKAKKKLAWLLYGKKDTQSAACIIATSEQEYNAVRSLGITAPIAIVPNGIEIDTFPKSISHTYHDGKVMLFLSRINPIKGIEYLIEAWQAIPPKEREGWQIHIVGNSDPKEYINELEKRVSELGLFDSIKFLGPITGENKIKKYQESDVFVLPTLNENFGNVIAEAMMCELPVITTTNAPWKVINDYECGWWINLSVEGLTKALHEAITMTDEERWELGKKGRRCIEDNYASPAVAKKTVEIYKWVLGMTGKPDYVFLK